MALRESQQITRIQSDQLSVAHGTRSMPGTPYFRFSQDYTVVNARCQRQSSTHAITINTASEENTLSLLPYGDSYISYCFPMQDLLLLISALLKAQVVQMPALTILLKKMRCHFSQMQGICFMIT